MCNSCTIATGYITGRIPFWQYRLRGVQLEVGVLLAQAASSSALQRQWRSLGARSMLDARSFMISKLRSQVGSARDIIWLANGNGEPRSIPCCG
jgi:hypothetical protein